MILPYAESVKNAGTEHIRQAQLEDSRHRLHAEMANSAAMASSYYPEWKKAYLDVMITSARTRTQVELNITWPLATNELVDDISDSASSVHKAQDRFISIELSDEKLQAEAQKWLEEKDIDGFITRQCHTNHFAGPNCLVIVDTAVEQMDNWPDPYVYLLPSDKIEKAEALEASNKLGLLRYAMFKVKGGKDQVAMFDDTHISVYERNPDNAADLINGFKLVSSEPHNLPFCPAFKMWADISTTNPLVSNSILRPSLALLDEYMFWKGGMNTNDLKAAFAIFWHWKEKQVPCTYMYDDLFPCEEGFCQTRPVTNGVINWDGIVKKRPCPRCAERAKAKVGGPGSSMPLDQPSSKEEFDLRLPAGWIAADVPSLVYIKDKVADTRAQIRRTATGSEGGPQNKQAINEDQILSIIEAARQVGEYLAEYFELLHKRILDAMLGMRYGKYYVGCTVNYGRRFAALNGDLLMKLMESAKTIGSEWLLEEIDNMLMDYYARSDASRGLRYKIISDLKKYKFMTASEMTSAQIPTLDLEGYLLSVAVLDYIGQFEREQGVPIERFGILTPYSNRITLIRKTIQSYVTAQADTIRAEREQQQQRELAVAGKQANAKGNRKPTKP